jgi:hypothetical protein
MKLGDPEARRRQWIEVTGQRPREARHLEWLGLLVGGRAPEAPDLDIRRGVEVIGTPPSESCSTRIVPKPKHGWMMLNAKNLPALSTRAASRTAPS